MTTSTASFGPDYIKDLIPQLLHAADEGARTGYHIIWDAFMSSLMQHWLEVLVFAILLLAFAVAVYVFTGRWAFLGSVLYHYLYFGILFLIGLIRGPEVFASEYIEIFYKLLLYPFCYFLVRVILTKSGIRKRY